MVMSRSEFFFFSNSDIQVFGQTNPKSDQFNPTEISYQPPK